MQARTFADLVEFLVGNGIRRGVIELKKTWKAILGYIFMPVAALVVLYFINQEVSAPGVGRSSGALVVALLILNVAFGAFMGTAANVLEEKQNGTLSRMKQVPFGLRSYLLGKMLSQAVVLSAVSFLVTLGVARGLFPGVISVNVTELPLVLLIFLLGVLAFLPAGIAAAVWLTHPRQLSFLSLLVVICTFISGVFVPLEEMVQPIQAIGYTLPFYWMISALQELLVVGSGSNVLSSAWLYFVPLMWAMVGMAAALFVLNVQSRR